MSNRPAEHSDGDRSTRNAAFGAEIIRFRAIRGHLGPERPLPRQFRNSGRLRRLRPLVTYGPRLRRQPARRQRPQAHRGSRFRSKRFGARRTFASRPKINEPQKMRRTIDSHHHGELPAAKELIHDSMRRSTAGPADFRTFWTHACAREVGFTSARRSRTILP